MSERIETVVTYRVDIYIAGDLDDARRICRDYCMRTGYCVTVELCEYIYTGGSEAGVRVGAINYPRFPVEPQAVWTKAEALARELLTGLHQWSALIEATDRTMWISGKPENATPRPAKDESHDPA